MTHRFLERPFNVVLMTFGVAVMLFSWAGIFPVPRSPLGALYWLGVLVISWLWVLVLRLVLRRLDAEAPARGGRAAWPVIALLLVLVAREADLITIHAASASWRPGLLTSEEHEVVRPAPAVEPGGESRLEVAGPIGPALEASLRRWFGALDRDLGEYLIEMSIAAERLDEGVGIGIPLYRRVDGHAVFVVSYELRARDGAYLVRGNYRSDQQLRGTIKGLCSIPDSRRLARAQYRNQLAIGLQAHLDSVRVAARREAGR